MSKKAKNKETMFEEGMQFTSLEHAKQVSEKERKKLIFKLICAGLSVLTTIVWLLFYFTGIEGTAAEDILGIPLVIGLIAMLVCTNINYLRYLWKSIKIAWFLIPIFPIDLFCSIFGAAAFFALSVYMPVIPCLMTLRQSHITKKDADEYISACEYGCEPVGINEN